MNIFSHKLTIFLITFFQITPVFSALEFTFDANASRRNVDVSGPADQLSYGSIILNSGSYSRAICNNSTLNYTLRNILYEPVATWTGRTHQETTSHPIIQLYESGVAGFSLTPMGGNTAEGYPANFSALPPTPKVVWSGTVDNTTRISDGHRMTTGVYVYKDERRITEATILPEQTLYRYMCQDETGTTQEVYNFVFRQVTVTGSITGCAPTENAMVIDMDKIAQSSIVNADASTLIGTKRRTFSLLCDPGINVSLSFVDLTDQTNFTTTAKLTADSTATGVGFAVSGTSGLPLQFGPDGSSPNTPNQRKYFIQTAGSTYNNRNNPVSVSLGFSYVRKPEEELKAGTAKSIIGLTYSYQ